MKGPEREEERNMGGEGEEIEAQTFRPTLKQWSDLPRLSFERLKCVILIIVLHFSWSIFQIPESALDTRPLITGTSPTSRAPVPPRQG